ncbi:MAG: hypothetical protein J6S67_21415 [Methanobrevibacter sp.]|nr:hypothetical protein [Methanobrevibacter sp.]
MFKLIEDTYYTINELEKILEDAKDIKISKNYNQIEYYDLVCAFDIETSNFEVEASGDGQHKRSIMYVWQLAINGRVIIGREWSEFLYVIDKLVNILGLNKKKRLVIGIHNLAFEFQYIRKLFNWSKVFAIDTRKPIYAITENGIEFRCTYILTNYSLAKLGDQLLKYKVSKMVGDLDYKQLRTPLTPLTDKEIQYCINDVLVVSAYLQEQIEIEGHIWRIPYTATGYCRRYVRYNCLYKGGARFQKYQYQKYHKLMDGMKITDLEEYQQLQRAFAGGFTHAAFEFSGMVVTDADSIDFTSSYPYALLSEQYPMSTAKLVTINSVEELEYYLKYYCCLFDVEFENIRPAFKYENYISISKCFIKINETVNNGRLYKADMIGTTITEVDYKIIRKVYKFDKCRIYNFRIYKKGYLPKEIITSIIKLYQDKTTLKNVKGKELEYLNSKGLLNAIYGMMVTDIIRDTITYNNEDEWSVTKPQSEKELERYNNSRKRFNFYPWGVWCTAYSRRNLWTGIVEFGKDYIYSDTDSCKVLNIKEHQEYIDAYNAMTERKLKTMCKYHKIDYSELQPKTIKGEIKPLGVWDYEGHYDRFKTLGAKRYMVQEGDELSITVSGVNKKVAVPYLRETYSIEDCFRAFSEGLVIPAEKTGKLTHYYIDNEYKGTIKDINGIEYNYTALSGVFLEPAAYEFDLSAEYIKFLKGMFYTK